MTDSDSWTATDARARFGELIQRALTSGQPQTITHNGRKVAIVTPAEEAKPTKVREGTLADFFARSPLRGSGIKIERLRGRVREIEL